MTRNDESDLRGRVKDLRAALTIAGDRIDPSVADHAERTTNGVSERLDLGVDHTVVALIGGTGSGKSSLFNAISGLKFADVGVRRPTTSTLAACAWSPGVGKLLDWLEVSPDRRIDRVSALDGAAEEALRGLVLLDLPDYDSIATAHRAVVDRVLPMVDLLVWVVDPQKYADDALHSGYLRGLVGAQGAMLVVLNQIDTIVEDQRDAIVADVCRLLAEDGLDEVEVVVSSAVTGEGIASLREHLAMVVARRSVAAVRVAGELNEAATDVAAHLSALVPRRVDQHVDRTAQALGEIVGIESRANTVADSTHDDGSGAPEQITLTGSNLEPIRAQWLTGIGQDLSAGWFAALDAAVPDAAQIADRLNSAMATVQVRPVRAARRRALRTLVVVFAVAGAIAGVAALGFGLNWFSMPDGGSALTLVAAVVAAASLVAALACAVGLRATTGGDSSARRGDYARQASEQIREVIGQQLVDPTATLLEDHHEARTLALAAFDSVD